MSAGNLAAGTTGITSHRSSAPGVLGFGLGIYGADRYGDNLFADCLLALDARVVVYGNEVAQEKLPRLAIRSYPQLEFSVAIRTIKASVSPSMGGRPG